MDNDVNYNHKKVSFVHVADCHIDFTPDLPYSKAKRRRKDFETKFSEICNYVLENNVDFFIIAGDLFDRINPRNASRLFIAGQFIRLFRAGVKIFIVGGNHEMPKSESDSCSPLEIYHKLGIIHFFGNLTEVEYVTQKINGIKVCISGLSYNHGIGPEGNILKKPDIPTEGDINIFISHGNLDFFGRKRDNEYIINANDIPPEVGYVALGHYHRYRIKVRRNGHNSETVFAYSGSPENFRIDTPLHKKGFLHVTFDGNNGLSYRFIDINTRPVYYLEVRLSGKEKDINRFIEERIDDRLDMYLLKTGINPSDLILKIKLTGVINPDNIETYKKINLIKKYGRRIFHLIIDDMSGLRYGSYINPYYSDKKHRTPPEYVKEFLERRFRESGDKEFMEAVRKKVMDLFYKYYLN